MQAIETSEALPALKHYHLQTEKGQLDGCTKARGPTSNHNCTTAFQPSPRTRRGHVFGLRTPCIKFCPELLGLPVSAQQHSNRFVRVAPGSSDRRPGSWARECCRCFGATCCGGSKHCKSEELREGSKCRPQVLSGAEHFEERWCFGSTTDVRVLGIKPRGPWTKCVLQHGLAWLAGSFRAAVLKTCRAVRDDVLAGLSSWSRGRPNRGSNFHQGRRGPLDGCDTTTALRRWHRLTSTVPSAVDVLSFNNPCWLSSTRNKTSP
mmetsp:Transcript_64989/g.171971  ORF Transcript_64989/g.171971 Transcript_64989/m.171971 type:complete len:263 (-) Transcript_64989:1181-1969(-)